MIRALKKIFNLNDELESTSSSFLENRIAVYALLFLLVTQFFFAALQYITGNVFQAMVNSAFWIICLVAYLDFVSFRNFQRLENEVLIIVYLLLSVLTIVDQVQGFALVWMQFFPLIAVFLKGIRKGLLHILLFYCVIVVLASQGVGEWPDGPWPVTKAFRFAFLSLTMVAVVIYIKYVYDDLNTSLLLSLKKERELASEMERYSVTDPLTGLLNRRNLQKIYENETRRIGRDGKYLCFLTFDIDYFKKFNDNFGHAKGDKALKQVAQVFQNSLRRVSDAGFRLGGEEFGGFFGAASEQAAFEFAELVRQRVEDLQISNPGSQCSDVLTVSVGVNILLDANGTDFATLYKGADQALYAAKAAGRNRTMVYQGKEDGAQGES